MAKGKSIRAIWECTESGLTTGVFGIQKDKIKDLKLRKFDKNLRKHVVMRAKVAKNSNNK